MKEKLSELSTLKGIDNFVQENESYINEILESAEDKDTLNKRNDDEWVYSEFKVILAGIKLQRSNKIIKATVYIPTNPLVAYKGKDRKLFERGKASFHPMKEELGKFLSDSTDSEVAPFLARFSAGGNLTILKTPTLDSYLLNKEKATPLEYEEHIVINQRDNHPKVLYKNVFALASGIAEDIGDWINPRLVIACESVEEIIITKKDEDIRFQPDFETYDQSQLNKRAEKIAERREIWLTYYQTEYGHEKPLRPIQLGTTPHPCLTEIIDIGNDCIEIHELENGKLHTYHGKLVIDPEIAVLDLMTAVRYNLPLPMSMLRLTDGEGTKADNTEVPKLLWRNIYAFKKEEFKKLFEGKESQADYFFGRNINEKGDYIIDRWYDGVPVKISAKPPMGPPLVGAGIALLEHLYNCKIQFYSKKEFQFPKLTILEDEKK